MEHNQTERTYEEKRLKQTISLAEEQLKQAKETAEKKKTEIVEAKVTVQHPVKGTLIFGQNRENKISVSSLL